MKLNNLRLKLDRAAVALEELAAKGPLKPEELRGLDNVEEYIKNEDLTAINGMKKMPPKVGVREVKDETNYRTGWVLSEEMTQKMLEIATNTKKMVYKGQVDAKKILNDKEMLEQLDVIRGIIMMTYPGYHGLGEWEPVRVILENQEEYDDKMDFSDDLAVENCIIWICGKEMQAKKLFSDYFGKNEKSKMVVKVT